jgi:hypothetical protein
MESQPSSSLQPEVASFHAGKFVFLTGATGFVGKVRSFPSDLMAFKFPGLSGKAPPLVSQRRWRLHPHPW